eukprot:403364724
MSDKQITQTVDSQDPEQENSSDPTLNSKHISRMSLNSNYIRNKSENSLSFSIFENGRKLKIYLQSQKRQCDLELICIQEVLIEIIKKSGPCVNYYTILLNELSQVVDQLIDINYEHILHIDLYKKIILKFEKARVDFMSRVQNNENIQTATQQRSVMELDQIFSQFRYILTRFGRVINFTDVLVQAYKRKQFASSQSVKLQAPVIKRILEQESFRQGNSTGISNSSSQASMTTPPSYNYSSDQLNKNSSVKRQYLRSPSSGSSHSSNMYGGSVNTATNEKQLFRDNLSATTVTGTNSLQQTPKIKPKNKIFNTYLTENFQNNIVQDKIWEMLKEMSSSEKSQVFEKYMTNLSSKWRDEYEREKTEGAIDHLQNVLLEFLRRPRKRALKMLYGQDYQTKGNDSTKSEVLRHLEQTY